MNYNNVLTANSISQYHQGSAEDVLMKMSAMATKAIYSICDACQGTIDVEKSESGRRISQ